VEVVGTLTWALLAFVLYHMLSATALARRLNRVHLRWLQVVAMTLLVLAGAYVGALLRMQVVGSLHVTFTWLIESIAMILTVVITGTAPLALMSWLFYWLAMRPSRS
jgi:hypothetical protein